MRGWKDLEVVETIYEDEEIDDHHEEEDEDSSSSSTSPTSSSSHNSLSLTPSNLLTTTLESIVQAWSLATGLKTDVMIYVQDQCFHLHKDPLTSRSGYLRQHLKGSSKLNLSPPLNLTAETFTTIVDFCYSSHIVITPFNVARLRIAAELLDMNGENGEENLQLITESYFRRAVSVNGDYTSVILRSCLAFLPEAEETASLVSRCIQALTENFDGVNGWIDDVKSLEINHFQIIADSMQERMRYTRNHDLLYKIVDAYLEEQGRKLTEEQKTRICSTVDCSKLSPHILMHAVQNPSMPLRFIVRAMFVEQINTRHSIISTLTAKNHHQNTNKINKKESKVITLGRILQRDAAIRHVAQLKASVEATSSKIQSLERDLMGMKQILSESKNKRDNALDSTRSASFHFSTESRVVDKGERGSTSSVSFRFSDRGEVIGGSSPSSTLEGFSNEKKRTHKSLGWRLINGLKTTFRLSSSVSSSKPDTESRISTNVGGNEDVNGDVNEDEEVVVEIKQDIQSHRRSRSLVLN